MVAPTPILGERYRGSALLVTQSETAIIVENISSSPTAIRISWDEQDPYGTGVCPDSPGDCFIDDSVAPGQRIGGKIKNHSSVQIWAWGAQGNLVDSTNLRVSP